MEKKKVAETVSEMDAEFRKVVLDEAKAADKENEVKFELNFVLDDGRVQEYDPEAETPEAIIRETAWWEVYDGHGDVLVEEMSHDLCFAGNGGIDRYMDLSLVRCQAKALFKKTVETETKYVGED